LRFLAFPSCQWINPVLYPQDESLLLTQIRVPPEPSISIIPSMPSSSPQLDWCIVRLGEDLNWWVTDISDDVHWDVDGLSIIDPRQISHLVELCEPLREYGFSFDVLDQAFFTFRIERELEDGRIRLIRAREDISESEDRLFCLPNILDEEKGPYADFLDQITKVRVKLLNDLIDFEQKLTIDELEEEIRERQNGDFLEGRATHFFHEISAILEYVPVGFELDEDEVGADEEEIEDFPDLVDTEDEKIEEDETMRWDEDDEEEEEEEEDLTEARAGDDEATEDWGASEEEDDEEKPARKDNGKDSGKKPAKGAAPASSKKPAAKTKAVAPAKSVTQPASKAKAKSAPAKKPAGKKR